MCEITSWRYMLAPYPHRLHQLRNSTNLCKTETPLRAQCHLLIVWRGHDYIFSGPSTGTSLTKIIRLNALRRFQSCTYTLHCTYMKTKPPVNPIATTTSLVQKGQSNCPALISSAVRSIRTHSDHTTHVIAITWNDTEQRILRRSLLVMSRAFH